MVKQTKKIKEIAQLVDRTKTYPPEEAIGLAKQAAKARFDETVELHLRMGVDPRNATQQVRGVAKSAAGLSRKPACSIEPACFFVGRGEKDDVAIQLDVALGQFEQGEQMNDPDALRVQSASSEDHPILDDSVEGARPFLH